MKGTVGRLGWAVHITLMEKSRNACKVEKAKGKRP